MGGASIWHWVVVGGIVVLMFGRGKISEMMGDVAKGIKAFKKGMSDDEAVTPTATAAPAPTTELPRTLEHQPAPPSTAATSTLADRKIG